MVDYIYAQFSCVSSVSAPCQNEILNILVCPSPLPPSFQIENCSKHIRDLLRLGREFAKDLLQVWWKLVIDLNQDLIRDKTNLLKVTSWRLVRDFLNT